MNKNCPYFELNCNKLQCDCPKYKAYVDSKNPDIFYRVIKENEFDLTQSTFDLIMSMQHSFASRMRKVDNLTKEEQDIWIDKYLVCIEDEVREVREHLNIYCDDKKYNSDNDRNIELKKEVIDILHFVMELFIVGNAGQDDIKKYYNEFINIDNNEDLIHTAYQVQKDTVYYYLNGNRKPNSDITILKSSCKLLDACSLVRQQISWKHWKKPNKFINYDSLYRAYAAVFYEFINLCVLTMDESEIKSIYIQKNVENILRQEYGY